MDCVLIFQLLLLPYVSTSIFCSKLEDRFYKLQFSFVKSLEGDGKVRRDRKNLLLLFTCSCVILTVILHLWSLSETSWAAFLLTCLSLSLEETLLWVPERPALGELCLIFWGWSSFGKFSSNVLGSSKLQPLPFLHKTVKTGAASVK